MPTCWFSPSVPATFRAGTQKLGPPSSAFPGELVAVESEGEQWGLGLAFQDGMLASPGVAADTVLPWQLAQSVSAATAKFCPLAYT